MYSYTTIDPRQQELERLWDQSPTFTFVVMRVVPSLDNQLVLGKELGTISASTPKEAKLLYIQGVSSGRYPPNTQLVQYTPPEEPAIELTDDDIEVISDTGSSEEPIQLTDLDLEVVSSLE